MPQKRMLELLSDAKALIFDCDGTLADTMPLHDAAWEAVLRENSCVLSRDEFTRHRGRTPLEFLKEMTLEKGWSIDPVAVARAKDQRYSSTLTHVTPILPVVEIVDLFRGKLPMAVVSGGTAIDVRFTLKALGILDAFKVILTADDPVQPKPSPEIFLAAARSLGVAPEGCAVFEDADSGLLGARLARMRGIDVRPYIVSS